MKTKEVAKLLGKCEETIKRNAKKIGKVMSKAGTEWTDEEIELLRKQLEFNETSHQRVGLNNKGKKRPKISEALKGKKASEETRRKMSETRKGHIVSEETRRKISEAEKGKKVSEETREKLKKINLERKAVKTSEYFLNENTDFEGIFLEDIKNEVGYSNTSPLYKFSKYIDYVYYKNQKLAYVKVEKKDDLIKEIKSCSSSIPEREIADFLEKYIEIERNTRKVINPLELDVYIPSKKVAVEFNGLYWHSKCDKNYHYCKMKECEKAGIRCIQIFEDEWRDKQEIVKSILLSAIGVYERKVFARKCKVKEIETKIGNQFLDENHINGSVKTATKAYGLFYNDELLQVITVGVNRFTKERKLELLRMATKKNCQVVGGFSKLLKDSGIEEIESYVDRRIYNGSGYASSGWTVIGESEPAYYYTNFRVRKNRMSFMKCKLPPVEGIEGGGTELERATKLGWYRIYDCGTIKLKWIK